MWFIMILASITFGLLNPYVGLFTIFNIVQCFIMMCFYVIGIVRLNQFRKELSESRKSLLLKLIRACLIAFCTTSVVLFGITTVVSMVVHLLTSGQLDGIHSGVPYDLLGINGNLTACNRLLICQVASNAVGMLLSIAKSAGLLNPLRGYK